MSSADAIFDAIFDRSSLDYPGAGAVGNNCPGRGVD
jgi:hypothetical protein